MTFVYQPLDDQLADFSGCPKYRDIHAFTIPDAANDNNGFVQWVYESSSVLLDPFRGIFPTRELASGSVIDFSAPFAMVVYGLLGMLLIYLVAALTPSEPVTTKNR